MVLGFVSEAVSASGVGWELMGARPGGLAGTPRASLGLQDEPDQRGVESPGCPGHPHPTRKPVYQRFCFSGVT